MDFCNWLGKVDIDGASPSETSQIRLKKKQLGNLPSYQHLPLLCERQNPVSIVSLHSGYRCELRVKRKIRMAIFDHHNNPIRESPKRCKVKTIASVRAWANSVKCGLIVDIDQMKILNNCTYQEYQEECK